MTPPAAKTLLGLDTGLLFALGGSVIVHGIALFAIPVTPQTGSAQRAPLAAHLLAVTAPANSGMPRRQAALKQAHAATGLQAADAQPAAALAEVRDAATATEDSAASASTAVASPAASSYFSMEQLDAPPHLLGEVQQVYPARARLAAVEGFVTLALLINERGEVEDASVVRARPAGYFEEAALAMLRKQRFSPPIKQNQAVKSRWLTTVRYRLQD